MKRFALHCTLIVLAALIVFSLVSCEERVIWSDRVETSNCPINKEGEQLIDIPTEMYSNVFTSNQGAITVRDQTTQLWGVLNDSGSWHIEPQFRQIGAFSDFYEDGSLYATAQSDSNWLWGIIDFNGNWVLEPQYAEISSSNLSAGVMVAKDDKTQCWGFADFNGNWVLEPTFRVISDIDYSLNGSATANAVAEKDGGWGRIDLEGNWIVPPLFDLPFEFTEGGIAFASYHGNDELFGIIDTQGNFIVEPVYSHIPYYRGTSMAPLTDPTTGLCGAVDIYGNWSISPQYDQVSNADRYANGLVMIKACRNGLWGILSEDEQWIIDPIYERIDITQDGEMIVAQDAITDLYGVMDREQNWIVQPEFTNIKGALPYRSKAELDLTIFPAQDKSMLWGYINLNGEWVIEPQFMDANCFDTSGIAMVEREYQIIKYEGGETETKLLK